MVQMVETAVAQRLSRELGRMAKLLASGVFVCGREPDEVFKNDLTDSFMVGMEGELHSTYSAARVAHSVDRAAGLVTMSQDGVSRSAVYTGGQGCVILPGNGSGLRFAPTPVESKLPAAATTPWPLGDQLPDTPAEGVDARRLAEALDWGFDDARQPALMGTRAVVVCHRGRLVGERYAPGFTANTPHISWSAGKSITAALIGLLVRDGLVGLDDYAPIAEWQTLDDPRRMIRVRHLLNMSSGLLFRRAGQGDPVDIALTPLDDHMYIYWGAIDVFEHSISRPLEFVPGTYWRYRNSDPLTLGAIVRRTVEARGESYHTFPQRALFDRIGARSFTLETDPWGNFIMSGYDYATARDWARFGLLHLWDGEFQGERVLPAGWAGFVGSPAPADQSRGYGGQCWVNAGGRHPSIPRDAYWPAGHGGQVTYIIPSRDVVITRLGCPSPAALSGKHLDPYLDGLVGRLLAALPAD